VIGALLVVVVIISSLVVGSAQPTPSHWLPVDTIGDARLELLPVTRIRPGTCPGKSSHTVSSEALDQCLTVIQGLIVTQPATATVVPDATGDWDVKVFLTRSNARLYAQMTARLSWQPSPRNRLAIMIGDPPDGQLLGSPAVTTRIDGPINLPAGSRAQAYQLLEQITR